MKCAIVALRRGGMILKASELAEPVEGQLDVMDAGLLVKDGKPQRFMRAAHFRTDDGEHTYMRQAMPPLFDPRIVKLEGRELILEGVQLACDGAKGPMHEHVQVWQCKIR